MGFFHFLTNLGEEIVFSPSPFFFPGHFSLSSASSALEGCIESDRIKQQGVEESKDTKGFQMPVENLFIQHLGHYHLIGFSLCVIVLVSRKKMPASLVAERSSAEFCRLHFPLSPSFCLKEAAFPASSVITKNTQSPLCSPSDLYI